MPEHARVSVTAEDEGRIIRVPLGAELAVRLPENASTGFRWAVERAGRRLLEPIHGDVVAPPPAGSAGTRTFVFRASAPGRGRLRFKLWRAWEGDASIARRVTVTVLVEGRPGDGATDPTGP